MLGNFLVPLSGPSRDNRYSVRNGRRVRSQPRKYCRSPYSSDGIEQTADQCLRNDNYFLKLSENSGFFFHLSLLKSL